MAKVNLQVRLSEELDSQISQLAPRFKSEFVRQAVQEKIQREMFKKLEAQWVKALKKDSKEEASAQDWLNAEAWGPR